MPSFAEQAKAKGLKLHATSTEAFTSKPTWYEDDKVVTLVPKFKIKEDEGMMENFLAVLPKFLKAVREKEAASCIHYSFVGPSEEGFVICREGYTSAKGVLKHLEVVGDLLIEAQKYADIVEILVQGPAEELEKLKESLAPLGADFFPTISGGFRNKRQW